VVAEYTGRGPTRARIALEAVLLEPEPAGASEG
jgi:hypothetical protein